MAVAGTNHCLCSPVTGYCNYWPEIWYNTHPDTDQPNLNARGAQMVGQVSVLIDAMENGSGRIKLGDTVWRVEGPDLPAGSKVRVVDSSAATLRVEASEKLTD